jgi:xylose isomerase
MLGSIDANQGDSLLGWDTDKFPSDVYMATMCMYEILKAGGLTGGINFDAKTRRQSYAYDDLIIGFILAMDTYALGLIKADALIRDGRLEEFIYQRYSSFNSDIGKKIRSGKATLEELCDYACGKRTAEIPMSGRQECLEMIVNDILFN